MKNPTHLFASTFGAIMALAGIEHGIGEILQGSVAPAGLVFPSWPEADFFRTLGGEPAMSIIPNMLVTGTLAVLISLALLVWALFFVHRRHGGLVMMLLSAVLLPLGGGIFPPVLGVLVGATATRIHSPLTWWRNHLSPATRRVFKTIWPWSFAVSVLSYLALTPGIGLLNYFFGIDNVALILGLIFVALFTLLLTVITGFARSASPGQERLRTR